MAGAFYDSLARHYHLIFDDWDAAMRRQGAVLAGLLPPPEEAGAVLDCACGIGTQALALAARGYRVESSGLSPAAVARTGRETAARGLDPGFRVDDMRTLAAALAERAGLRNVRVMPTRESGYYQPVIRAMAPELSPGRKPHTS